MNDKKAYAMAAESLEKDAIKEEDFAYLYGEENVRRDLEKVAAAESDFKQRETPESEQLKRYSTIFEWIVNERVELSDYFGSNAFTRRASHYDDLMNGVDTILEFRNDPEESKQASYLTLGIDDTFSTRPEVQEKKLRRIKSKIDSGKLTQVKYFSSDYMNFRGELKNVPLIVLGTELRTVAQLRDLMLSRDNKILDSHPIQHLLLQEAKLETDTFSGYAERSGRADLAEIYKNTGRIIDEIIAGKGDFDRTILDRDRVFQTMQLALHEIFGK
ncbi:MAG: hypothetical protein M1324_00135 [Patescibacteria group bacterium]|nr:hypothetical protein [Patescibacteria group bacterium]